MTEGKLKLLHQVSDEDNSVLWLQSRNELEKMYEDSGIEFQPELDKIHTKIEELTGMTRHIGEYNRFFHYFVTKAKEVKFSNPKYWYMTGSEIVKNVNNDAEHIKLERIFSDLGLDDCRLNKYIESCVESVLEDCIMEFLID